MYKIFLKNIYNFHNKMLFCANFDKPYMII